MRDGSVEVDAIFMYADLAGSSVLAEKCPWSTTAKIIKSYLLCATRLIRYYKGHIRSFDGDRVMGVFIGEDADTAVSCARQIDWCVTNIVATTSNAHFKSIQDNAIRIKHCIGLDFGKARAVRAGIRDNSDLIWIGKAPSFAAKLSDVRDFPNEIYASSRIFNRLSREQKIVNGNNIWISKNFTFAGASETVYCTNYSKEP